VAGIDLAFDEAHLALSPERRKIVTHAAPPAPEHIRVWAEKYFNINFL
jgi:hypothetical protein